LSSAGRRRRAWRSKRRSDPAALVGDREAAARRAAKHFRERMRLHLEPSSWQRDRGVRDAPAAPGRSTGAAASRARRRGRRGWRRRRSSGFPAASAHRLGHRRRGAYSSPIRASQADTTDDSPRSASGTPPRRPAPRGEIRGRAGRALAGTSARRLGGRRAVDEGQRTALALASRRRRRRVRRLRPVGTLRVVRRCTKVTSGRVVRSARRRSVGARFARRRRAPSACVVHERAELEGERVAGPWRARSSGKRTLGIRKTKGPFTSRPLSSGTASDRFREKGADFA